MKTFSLVIFIVLFSTACSHDRRGTDAGAGYTHSDPGVKDVQEDEMSQGDPQKN